ncbi:PP2C family protein-serine/threonine phosphatase [Alkalitalea saponilacus]|uniref:Stage II sporulation protein E (SpoIIE) n=1 Tax=Alkalitalea saponilacus TaxID=889453 RepID=A0A1T5D5U9_9BACT|nr:response regulator [Alkalitalea saponilacus]ASB50592.1 hypothetical protein CDL62_16285 [Alkalitalea saponilacus]SKB67084.1 Stage II sporulation protein E (SpoIIE) [Alkalitalea saponilacus]
MTDSSIRILLVDDSNLNLEILSDALRRYNPITAINGEKAIELAAQPPPPDLILLDIIMPGLNGIDVCKQLKQNPKTAEIPVIFITAQSDSTTILQGFEVGAIDYITKPFNIPELMARVKTQITIKLARDQNRRLMQKIEGMNQKLTDSIRYARKIQHASLPKQDFLKKNMPEHFILFKPKDIVSGDFYWIKNIDNKLVIVAADCTGHGVPGAIMSIFGIAYLHEIIDTNKVTQPATILNSLRSTLIESLQQDETSEIKDGMDICIVTLDKGKGVLEYAAAFNPLYKIRDNKITVFPADHMPVSIGETDNPYTHHAIQYQSGDCFYLFTDGFVSQFGGPNNKKIKHQRFREMLLNNYHLPMQEQLKIYDEYFETWRESQEQVDDVLLIGIRL